MKPVLLALLACAFAVGGALAASKLLGGSGLPEVADRFVRLYAGSPDLNSSELAEMVTIDRGSGGVGDEYAKQHRVIRRHMGKFVEIEKLLVDRIRIIAGSRAGDVQFVGRFEKGSAIVKLYLYEEAGRWLVDDIQVEIPPSLMRRTPDEFAEMIALECVRRISRGDFEALAYMTTQDFQLRYPGTVTAEAMTPLLEARGELTGLGMVASKTAGVNRRDTRVVALYKDGIPLAFEMPMVWVDNRWRVDDMSVEEAPGATVPEGALRGPKRVRRAPRKQ